VVTGSFPAECGSVADVSTVEPEWIRPALPGPETEPRRLDKRGYEKELERLQVELVRLQDWVVHKRLKVVVIFEGRDTAGKGGTIRRITETTNPRVVRIVARSGTSSATWLISRPPARSSCSTAAGTTAPALST
jgi:hypothetical protein